MEKICKNLTCFRKSAELRIYYSGEVPSETSFSRVPPGKRFWAGLRGTFRPVLFSVVPKLESKDARGRYAGVRSMTSSRDTGMSRTVRLLCGETERYFIAVAGSAAAVRLAARWTRRGPRLCEE